MNTDIYFDNNATTPLLPEVRNAMVQAMNDCYGNPSSSHSAGESSRVRIEQARQVLSALIGADTEQICFTSGGTEANNMVLRSAVNGRLQASRIITTVVEHSSILKTCERLEQEGATIVYLGVDRHGRIDLNELKTALAVNTTLVSIQWVNNESGIIQNITDISEICQKANVPLHTDAAQAIGKMDVNLSDTPIDYLTITGHKFHGPSGIGAIYSRDPSRLCPLLYGGSQERGNRAGTENTFGIVGFGMAASIRSRRLSNFIAHTSALRDEFKNAVLSRIPSTAVNGGDKHKICNTINLRFEGLNGQAIVAQLDAENIFCSQSSACTNNRPEPSYVLRAMGLSEKQAYNSIRFAFSEMNTQAEVRTVVDVLENCCSRLRTINECGFDRLENVNV